MALQAHIDEAPTHDEHDRGVRPSRVFGGFLMILGIIVQGDLAQHALFLGFGTTCLAAACVLRMVRPRGSA